MTNKYLLSIFITSFLFLGLNIYGQGYTYSGLVIDEQTKEALAFVNLISADAKYGTTTDIDGKFSISLPYRIDSIHFSYLGYNKMTVATNKLKLRSTIKLHPIQYDLAEYEVFPGVNPAHRIILNTIQNRDINNPQKMKAYSFTSYDKMVITIDSSFFKTDASKLIENDSLSEMTAFFKNQDLFLMESVVEKKFLSPDRSNEKVIATKVSGLKDPLMVYLVSQMQSTSFYDEIIQIVNKNYINPISKGSIQKYYFQMEDTMYSGKRDTVYTISYRPKRNTNFDGLQGILHISTNKWAIVNVKAQPAITKKVFTVQIQQRYDWINGKHWFPVQLNTNIIFDGMNVSSEGKNANLIGRGKSYIKDINLSPSLSPKDFSYIEIEIDPDAAFQDNKQWESYRNDSLSQRELKTYHYMDSLGKASNFDQKLRELETVLTGKIRWGKFDLLLNRFVGFNSFEGFWFGIGGLTNNRFSERLALGGYYAYSIKDKQAKVGAKATVLLYKPKEVKAHFSYMADNIESGDVEFLKDEASLFNPLAIQRFFINRMNYTQRKELGLSGRIFNYWQFYAGVNQEYIENNGGYLFQRAEDQTPFTNIQSAEIKLRFRFAYKEKYFNNGRLVYSMGTIYPIIWFNYTQGFEGISGSDFSFKKIDIQLRKSFYTKYIGETNIDLKAGFITGDLPYSKLYSGGGTYRPLAITAPASFGTMRPNEFLSDSYMFLFLRHNFGTLLFKGERFKPVFELITNIGFGWLSNSENHQNIDFKIMDKGYYESGLMIHELLRLQFVNVGFGAMYRYGPYSLGSYKENIAYKITILFPLQTK